MTDSYKESALLSDADRERVVADWNRTQRDYDLDGSLAQAFAAQAARTPEAVALVWSAQALTYRELEQRSNQWAHYLQTLGVGPEVLVGVCVERGIDMLVGILGVLKAGGAYVPLDPHYPPARSAFMLADTRAAVLLTQTHLVDSLPAHQARLVCLDAERETVAQYPSSAPDFRAASHNLAYIIYTSGSTGTPKGVAITQRSALAMVKWALDTFDPTLFSGTLAATSICFDLSIFEMFVPLCCGGTVLLAENILQLPEIAAARPVTLVNTVPSAMRELLRLGDLPASLRVVNLAGEPLKTALVQQIYAQSGVEKVFDLYGPSEDTTYSTFSLRSVAGPETIGRPIANTRLYLLDAHLNPLPVGEPGEIYLAGEGLARGYLQRPALTAASFIPNPFAIGPGERLYRSGDLARYLPDGNLEFLGRLDQQVKIRGYRIELGEIESALLAHPALCEALVLAREVRGDKRLVAYVAVDPAEDISPGQLASFLRERLPEYMVPAAFVLLERLPLTPNGKVDRRALPDPEWGQAVRETVFVPPASPLEQLLADVWQQVLGGPQVSVHDNFFALGGHSLMVTQVISRLRDGYQIDISMDAFFKHPTVAELAKIAREASAGVACAPLRPLAHVSAPPLSYAQQQLWFWEQLHPGLAVYNESFILHLDGALDVDALERACNALVARHAVLRTTFGRVDETPVQIIAPQLSLPLAQTDLSMLAEDVRAERFRHILEQTTQRPFDLQTGPLLRLHLLRLERDVQRLLLVLHHSIFDDWSLSIMLRELAVLYTAAVEKQDFSLPEQPFQYADFAVWQRENLQGARLVSLLEHWRSQMAGAPAMLNLQTDAPRPALPTFNGARQVLDLPPDLTAALVELARAEGVTLFMVLLAAFDVLLLRYTAQEDIVVGAPVANRTRSEVESLVGFFVNMLPLRADLSGTPTFRALLQRVRAVTLAAYQHQDLPFEKLVEALQIERNKVAFPLFQVAFALQNALSDLPQEMAGVRLHLETLGARAAKFDLSLSVELLGKGYRCVVEYNSDLFSTARMSRFLEHYRILLQGGMDDPDCRLANLPLLTLSERQQLLEAWVPESQDYARRPFVHERVAAQAARAPDAIAARFPQVVGRNFPSTLTYAELERRANCLAHKLRAHGVGPEVVVALYAEPAAEVLVALLAVLKAGGAYLPVAVDTPAARLKFILEDARAFIVLTQMRYLPDLEDLAIPVLCLDVGAGSPPQDTAPPAVALHPENLAYVIYTSGSTGRPKGVAVSHASLLNLVAWNIEAFDLSPIDRVTQIAGFGFDACVLDIWPCLVAGASLYTPPSEIRAFPAKLQRWLLDNAITASFMPTPLAESLLTRPWPTQSALRILSTGGDALHFYPPEGLSFALVNNYGPTEDTVVTTSMPVPSAARVPGVPPCIGWPIRNAQVYILDAYLNPVPAGVPGQLCIAGAGLARGYLHRPALSAEKFIPHPFSQTPGARLYLSGDLVRYQPDGCIEFLGRVDQQVKIRGFRIELGEIETVLLKAPAVQEAIVLAVESSNALGKQLVAFVVPAPGVTPVVGELRDFLVTSLPHYMLPAAFLFLDALPLTLNGKVDRRALVALAAVGGTVADAAAGEVAAPRSATERLLVDLWGQVLDVPQVGIHDNFFELGGHSLLAAQLLNRLQKHGGHTFSLAVLFDAPTVAELARKIDASSGAAELPAATITRVSRDRPLPLSFAQQSLWLIDQLTPGNVAYHTYIFLRVAGSLDQAALQESLALLPRRHESLRTVFDIVDGDPVQVILADLQVSLTLVDVPSGGFARVAELAKGQARQPFDLSHGPLLRATLYRLSPAEHYLLLVVHHIVIDGWSVGVLLAELAESYRALVSASETALPPLAVQYADFAVWQREWVAAGNQASALAYWTQHLAAAPQFLPLSLDHPRPAEQTYAGALEIAVFAETLSTKLREFCKREGHSLFMVLLATFSALLCRYSGQEDIVVGTPSANRNLPEVEDLIGYFVNTLAIRTTLQGELSFAELLEQVHATILAAFRHQHVPFQHVIEALHIKPPANYNPLFQVMFNFLQMDTFVPELPELTLTWAALDMGMAQFDFSLDVEADGDTLRGVVEYNTALFERHTARDILAHYQALLASALADPQQPLAVLWERAAIVVPRGKVIAAPVVDAPQVLPQQRLERRKARLASRRAGLSDKQRALLEKRLRGEEG